MSAMVEAAGWTLLHFLWQGAVIGALLALLLWGVKEVRIRYLAGCLAMLAMVFAAAGTFVHHYQPVIPEEPSVVVEPVGEDKLAATPFRTEHFLLRGTACRPCHLFVQETSAGKGTQVMFCPPTDQAVTLASGGEPTDAEGEETEEAIAAKGEEERSELTLMVGLWLGGVLLMCLRLLSSWIMVERLRRREGEPVDRALMESLQRIAARVGVRRAVQIVTSAAVTVPTVVGWFRPVILLPTASLLGLTRGQLEAVLAHELAHIGRFDTLVNLLQHTVETLLFFHPAVWWVSRKIREEREHCCDDVAVAAAGSALDYVQALATLEEMRADQSGLAMAANGGSLLTRIRRLSGTEIGRRSPMLVFPILILMGALVIPVTLVNSQVEARRDGERPTKEEGPAKSEQVRARPLVSDQAVLGLRHLLAKTPETDVPFEDFVLLAKALEQEKLVELLDEIGVQKDGYKPWTRMALYREWAGRDRDTALTHFLAKHEKRGWGARAQQVVYAIWSGSRPEDPLEALRYLRGIPHDANFEVEGAANKNYRTSSTTDWMKTAYERVFTELAAVDAELAWSEIPGHGHDREAGRREAGKNAAYPSMLRGFFRGLQDAPTIAKFVKRLGEVRSETLGIGIASAWMNHDLEAAQDWAPGQRNTPLEAVLIYGVKGNAAIEWAREHPEAALEVMRSNTLPRWRHQMAEAVLRSNPHLVEEVSALFGGNPQAVNRDLERLLEKAARDSGASIETSPITISERAESPPAIYQLILSTLSDNSRLQTTDSFPEPGWTNRPPDYRARYDSYRLAIRTLESERHRARLMKILEETFRGFLPEAAPNQPPPTD